MLHRMHTPGPPLRFGITAPKRKDRTRSRWSPFSCALSLRPGPRSDARRHQDGEIAREFHFTVGADGEVVREPFPGKKTIYAVEDSFPLKMQFKDNPDLEFDADAFRDGKLYGRE